MFRKQLQSLFLIICGLVLLKSTTGLYEDQIKKFDWRVTQIGQLKNAYFDLNLYNSRIIVETEENVIAALCPRTGEILWRQILETSPRGDIKLLQTFTEQISSTAAIRPNSKNSFDIVSVQGHAPALVRGWSSLTGTIEWEWSLMPLQPEKADRSFWVLNNLSLFHIIPIWNSHLEVTEYHTTTGKPHGTTVKINTPWINEENCIISGFNYVCTKDNQLISLDLTKDEHIFRKTLRKPIKTQPVAVKGSSNIQVIDKEPIFVNSNDDSCLQITGDNILQSTYKNRAIFIQSKVNKNILEISSVFADNCEQISELHTQINYPDHYGLPELQSFSCKYNRNEAKICSYVLSTLDGAILFVQQNKIRWARQESLANIVATELIDLPLSDSEGAIESELKSKPGDIAGAFLRRILSQISQMKHVFLHVIGLGLPPTATQKAGLIRDSFGLHKMLVVLTKTGKLFGIDNLSGKHHWMTYLPTIRNFNNDEKMKLFIQRTSKHFPKQPICTIVAKDKDNGNGVIYSFNPITGKPSKENLINLNYKIRQLTLLKEAERSDFLKGILLMDDKNQVHVFPENLKETADGMYLYTADKKTAVLNGFYIKLRKQNLDVDMIWNVRLGGHNENQQIISMAGKNPIEHVHSQGRVLGDRSVLYKYINPNLVAVVTEGLDNIHKYVANVYLVDVVSGSIIFSMTHRKVRGPVRVVHSENWLAYTYFNDKARRTEITTVELYEGKVQANSSAWSSLNAPPMPLVERQSYIIPTSVATLRETITERGITNKHVLIGTSNGAIVEMPWILLDPRRPITGPNQAREEGIIPYVPELPLPSENIINYNQTVARLNNIYTAPSGLESTCLVVATGLDMFVTRVSPSKTFDLLKEDFDYYLITLVLIALTTGSLVVKYLAARKILKQAWK